VYSCEDLLDCQHEFSVLAFLVLPKYLYFIIKQCVVPFLHEAVLLALGMGCHPFHLCFFYFSLWCLP